MADGRMLKKRISESKKLGSLKSDSARLLYTWLIPWLDVEGRYLADPDILKGHIFPKVKAMTPGKIRKLLIDLHESGLIILYSVNSEDYLEVTKFQEHQNIRKDREGDSKIPSPVKNSITTPGVVQDKSCLSKDKLREVKLSKEECRKYKYSDDHLFLSKLLEKKIKERMPRHRFIGKNYLDDWSNEVRIMEEKKEATLEEIKKLILWIFDEDNFWYKNVLSMDKLRKQFGRLWAEMEGKKSQQSEELLQEWMKEGSDAE